MKAIEVKSIQLGFGETVVIEKDPQKCIVKQGQFAIVPTKRGGYCEAELFQDIEVKKIKGRKIWGRMAYESAGPLDVGKYIPKEEQWKYWTIPGRPVIGVWSKQVKRKSSKEMIRIKKESALA